MADARKVARKEFFEVTAPMTSAKIHLYANSMEELEGKVVTLDLTRALRGKNMEMKMAIKKEGTGLIAEPLGLELMGSFIRRMFRKGVDYVEDSFTVSFKDSQVILKPFMLTRNKVPRGIRNSLRVEAKKLLETWATTRTTKEGFSDVLSNKIQKDLSIKLKKVYPLALCEIRVFKLVVAKK